jgi:hypothetical protein
MALSRLFRVLLFAVGGVLNLLDLLGYSAKMSFVSLIKPKVKYKSLRCECYSEVSKKNNSVAGSNYQRPIFTEGDPICCPPIRASAAPPQQHDLAQGISLGNCLLSLQMGSIP